MKHIFLALFIVSSACTITHSTGSSSQLPAPGAIKESTLSLKADETLPEAVKNLIAKSTEASKKMLNKADLDCLEKLRFDTITHFNTEASGGWILREPTPGEKDSFPTHVPGPFVYFVLTYQEPSEYRWEVLASSQPESYPEFFNFINFEQTSLDTSINPFVGLANIGTPLPQGIILRLLGSHQNIGKTAYNKALRRWPTVLMRRFNQAHTEIGWRMSLIEWDDYEATVALQQKNGNTWSMKVRKNESFPTRAITSFQLLK